MVDVYTKAKHYSRRMARGSKVGLFIEKHFSMLFSGALLLFLVVMLSTALMFSVSQGRSLFEDMEGNNNPLDPVGSYIFWCDGNSEFANMSPSLACTTADQVIPITKDFHVFSMLLRRAMDARRDFLEFEHRKTAAALKGQMIRNKPFEDGIKGAYEAYSLYAMALATKNLLLPVRGRDDIWLEFGVYTGGSANITGHIFRDSPLSIYGLDTFTGLPEDWKGHHPKGYYDLGGVLPPVKGNVKLYKGLFSESLPKILSGNPRVLGMNIDCNLYGGALDALEMTAPFWSVGTLIYFHKLQNSPKSQQLRFASQEEVKALHQFLVQHPEVSLEMIPVRNEYCEPVVFRVVKTVNS